MNDTTVKKVQSSTSPKGDQGQVYLVSGKRVAMRLWDEPPTRSEEPLPELLGRGRHVDMLDAQGLERVDQGVDDRSAGADGARLAAALHTHGVVLAEHLDRGEVEVRQVVGPGHAVVHEGAGDQLAVLVVDGVLEQRLADALDDAAMDLALDQHRVQDEAEIVDDGVVDDGHHAGVGVDLDLGDVAAVGEGPGIELDGGRGIEARPRSPRRRGHGLGLLAPAP
jgi:hypothetical protein